MAWFPSGVTHTLLADIPAATWNDWADGGSLDINDAPHRQGPKIHACRVTTDFETRDGIKYKKGMQGQLLEVNEVKGIAKIFIQGVTEGLGFTNRWVPMKFIEKGKPWQADINQWRIKMELSGHASFDKRYWESVSPPDTTVLGKTITRFITALRESPPNFVSQKAVDYLNKVSIAAVTQIIITGIKEAGLYGVLSSNRPFSGQDLVNASKFKIIDSNSSNGCGVYARFHKTGSTVIGRWQPHSSYVYIGKTNDFAVRNYAHKYTTSSYGDLTRKAEITEMIVLCMLPSSGEEGLHFLAEQTFVCLLETYRAELTGTSSSQSQLLSFWQSARYFLDLAEEVFRISGWQGFLRRVATCGIQYGANCSSPLTEYGERTDKLLYIRTDADIKDEETGLVVPMAFYRRSDPAVVNRSGGATRIMTKFIDKGTSKAKVVFTAGFNQKKDSKGLEVPLPGSPFEVVFEVRKDGTRHPHAWARLPQISPFRNVDQANSWAIRIEWQHPLGSGKWRYNYIPSGMYHVLADTGVPGSFITYAASISFLQWLTNSKPNHNWPWIRRLAGSARVLQTHYDFMDQVITFRNATNDIHMLPGTLLSAIEVEALMNKPEYGLERVGGTFGDFDGRPAPRRTRCDTCFLFGAGLRLAFKYNPKCQFPDPGCVQDSSNSRACTMCLFFGRPCCSWTAGIPTVQQHTVDDLATIQKFQSLLFRMPIRDIPEYKQSFTQQLRSFADQSIVEDDASDGEDEEDGEYDDDNYEYVEE